MLITVWAISFFVLWFVFINVMWLKDNREKVPKWAIMPVMAFVYTGILYDVIFNVVFGSFMFLGRPDFAGAPLRIKGVGLPTLSHRMRYILKEGKKVRVIEKWRYYLARFLCRYLVEPWDHNHCGLHTLGLEINDDQR